MCLSIKDNSRGNSGFFKTLFVPLTSNFARGKWDSPVDGGGCGNEKAKSEFTP